MSETAHLTLATQQRAGPIRREELFGRNHFVVPAVAVREMVLSNNVGKMYLPAEEIAASADAWNFTPVTLGHPKNRGQPTSARDPDVVNSRAVGILFNARFDADDRALKVGVFIDPEQAQNVTGGDELLAELERGEVGEVSTGFSFAADNTSGEFDGDEFELIARNLRPDHFAVGIEEGACSVEDGCGLGVNCNCEEHEMEADNAEQVADSLWERTKAHLTRSERMENEQIEALSDATGLSAERLAELEDDEIEQLADNVLADEAPSENGDEPEPEPDETVNNEPSTDVADKIATLEAKVEELSAERRERREELVGLLAENERCTFERADLEEFDLDRLEKVAQMAKVRNYGGRPVPRPSTGDDEVDLGFEVRSVWDDES